jgi:flavin reductase (DIM6/NTAB) family NADH-FMN oxidoreductase RutF
MNQGNNVFGWLPCSVVFVSTAYGEERDIMTATAMFVSEKEPLLLISVASNHLTEKLITRSGKFLIVIAGEDQKQLALQLGSLKGDGIDKFKHFSVKTISDDTGDALVPEGAAAWLACEVQSSQEITGYRLFIGRVVKQNDAGKPPLIWRKDGFFSLKPV